MQQIRIGRKAPVRQHRDRDAVPPLDPRDPDILRAKLLLRRRTVRTLPTGRESRFQCSVAVAPETPTVARGTNPNGRGGGQSVFAELGG